MIQPSTKSVRNSSANLRNLAEVLDGSRSDLSNSRRNLMYDPVVQGSKRFTQSP